MFCDLSDGRRGSTQLDALILSRSDQFAHRQCDDQFSVVCAGILGVSRDEIGARDGYYRRGVHAVCGDYEYLFWDNRRPSQEKAGICRLERNYAGTVCASGRDLCVTAGE